MSVQNKHFATAMYEFSLIDLLAAARICQASTVSQWLDQYLLSNYASLLIQNGYDHLHYLVRRLRLEEGSDWVVFEGERSPRLERLPMCPVKLGSAVEYVPFSYRIAIHNIISVAVSA